MPRDEFDRDLEDYLRARKRARSIDFKGFFSRFARKSDELGAVQKVEIPEQVEVYEEKKEPKAEHWVKKIFSNDQKNVPSEEFTREKMRADDAVNDMKEISKIALGMIRQLPDEQLKNFKQSQEFSRLKVLLKKNDLIK